MPFRYRLVGFGPNDVSNPRALLASVSRAELSGVEQPSFSQWGELVAHLHKAGAQTLLVQEGVRDPDFLEEYEAFYSKQHRAMQKFCVRIHAFSRPLPPSGPTELRQEVLQFIDDAAADQSSYLGFVTVRPLRHAPVGASIVVDTEATPALCKDIFPVHIAGTTFNVSGTPYLQQDNAVGACAQASMWMALRTLRRRSGNSAYSPAELTIAATRYITQNRVFPGRQGLTVEQMLLAIRASNHDPLVIPVAPHGFAANPYHAIAAAQPYIESGLPVVTVLLHPITQGHAVVAIGLSPQAPVNGFPPGLVIHNDNRGPYRDLPLAVAADSHEYSLEQTMSLIIPLLLIATES